MLAQLLEAAVRSMALGIIVWIILRVCRIRTLQTRSLVWTAVLLSALTMPLLSAFMARAMAKAPPSTVEWLGTNTSPLFLRPLTPVPSAPSASPMDWVILASIVYFSVAGVLCLRLLVGLLRSRRLCKTAVPLTEPWASGCNVRVSSELTIPVTFGATILLPSDWPQWSAFKRNAVFLHEMSHVRRRDFYILLLASLHRAVFWFSPLAWWLQNHLVELAEANCDDEAIRRVEDRVSYAEILVELAGKGSRAGFVGVAMARGKTVERRVERILREAGIAPEASLLRRLLIVVMLVPLAGLAAGLWHVQAKAISVPLVLTLPQQNTPLPAPMPAQPVPTAAPQEARPVAATGQELALWLEQEVPDIATGEERSAFQGLINYEERDQFIAAFWLRRDPTPSTNENEFRNEYLRRIAVANQRFTTPSGVRGWLTDRGRILIMHGEPDETTHTAGSTYPRDPSEGGGFTSTFPFERWRYRVIEGIGNNVQLTFVDTARDGNYRLDPKQKDLILKTIP